MSTELLDAEQLNERLKRRERDFFVDLRFEPCWDVMREEVPTPRSGRWSQYEAKFSLSLELGRIFLLTV